MNSPDALDPKTPVPRGPVPVLPSTPPTQLLQITIDGVDVTVSEGETILDAARRIGVETPTLCFLETLTPVNVCRICVVELEGSRALVPACSRKVEHGMVIHTDSERVRLSRRMVLEFLASSVDLSTAPQVASYMDRYDAHPERFRGSHENSVVSQRPDLAGPHETADASCERVPQNLKIDNDLYVRDYGKCILCYKCVQACGTEAQNTFAISVAGRGFDACISTEFDVPLTESACVYCGNCIGVCPTGALMFRSEYEMRKAGTWDESHQSTTNTICPYCGVGCTLTLHIQDQAIVKVTSPLEQEITHGHLCIKGRFGWEWVNQIGPAPDRGSEPRSATEGEAERNLE